MDFKEKELIIFDFDGTLINSVQDLASALNKMLLHYNLLPLTVEQVIPFVGNGAKLLVKRALEQSVQDKSKQKTSMQDISAQGKSAQNKSLQDRPEHDNGEEKEVSQELLKEAMGVFLNAYKENYCEQTYTYPGVVETLNYLNNKGYKLVIATNKPFQFIEPILKELAIKHFFKYWIGGDSLAEKKPNAAPLLHLAKEMNTSIDKCIMVGDSKNDILTAHNAGMESIGLTYGYNYNENIADYEPTIVVDSFSSLQELF